MKKFVLTLAICFAYTVVLAQAESSVSAQQTVNPSFPRCAQINSAELVKMLPEYTIVHDSIVLHANALFSQLNDLQQMLESRKKFVNNNANTMSPLLTNYYNEEISYLTQLTISFSRVIEQEMSEYEARLVFPLVSKLKDAVAKVAEQEQIDYVFDEAAKSVVESFGPQIIYSTTDILPQIEKELSLKRN